MRCSVVETDISDGGPTRAPWIISSILVTPWTYNSAVLQLREESLSGISVSVVTNKNNSSCGGVNGFYSALKPVVFGFHLVCVVYSETLKPTRVVFFNQRSRGFFMIELQGGQRA